MQGGTITSGRVPTFRRQRRVLDQLHDLVFETTAPSVVAILRPTSNTDSSVIEMRPFSKSLIRLLMPSVML